MSYKIQAFGPQRNPEYGIRDKVVNAISMNQTALSYNVCALPDNYRPEFSPMIENLPMLDNRATSLSAELQAWLVDLGHAEILVHACEIYPQKTLLPAEYELVANSVARRKAEFAAGRHCARRVLDRLGDFRQILAIGPKGEPLWPDGISGSISHGRHCAIAIATEGKGIRGVGIDLVDNGEKTEGVAPDLIADQDELRQFSEYVERKSGKLNPLLLVFSLKEAAIKAVSPSIDFYLDFREIELRPETESNQARACFRNLDIRTQGHWTVIQGMLVSFMWLSRAD